MASMPKRQLPYLNRQPGRHGNGKVYWYVRLRHGPRIPINGEYGTPAFMAAYYAAIKGEEIKAPAPSRASKGTLRWLCDQWKRSSDWAGTEPATQRQRDSFLQQMIVNAGDCAVEDIKREHVLAGREARQATPHAANNYLKTARALFRWAKDAQHIEVDPAHDVKFLVAKTKGFPPWQMEDVHAYRARWPIGTKERLALEIYINTGFRRSDAAMVGRQHVRDGVIHMKAGKNQVDLYIPILPALAEAIDALPATEMSFLTTKFGRPYTKESLGNVFKDWCKAAGIKGKSAHGIRKLAATVVADNGGSEQELQALFGWTTNTMSAVYTREANRKRQALQAAYKLMEELERNKDEKPLFLPNPMSKLPNP
jgi:integrase